MTINGMKYFQLVVELQLAIEWRDNARGNWDFCRAEIKCGIDESFYSDVKNLGIGKYHSPTHGSYSKSNLSRTF